eukprot:8421017-Ditylum_brightwellii.AAC.1
MDTDWDSILMFYFKGCQHDCSKDKHYLMKWCGGIKGLQGGGGEVFLKEINVGDQVLNVDKSCVLLEFL